MKKILSVLIASILLLTMLASAIASESPGNLNVEIVEVEVQPQPQQNNNNQPVNNQPANNQGDQAEEDTDTEENTDGEEETDTEKETELIAEETEVSLPDNLQIKLQPVNVDEYKSDTVADVVTDVNDDNKKTTVREVVEKMQESLPENAELDDNGILTIPQADDTVKTLDTKEYDFVTSFSQIVLTDGDTSTFEWNEEKLSVKARLRIDALIVRENADTIDVEDYLKDYQIMLLDPSTGELFFLDLDPESFDPVTGELLVEFPTLGVFAVIQKS